MQLKWLVFYFNLVCISFVFTACGSPYGSDIDNSKITVASTVSPITSIVASIGGDRINVIGIVPEGVDSHTYEPPPSIAIVLSEADIIFMNGLYLEEPILNMTHINQNDRTVIVKLGNKSITDQQWIYDDSFPELNGYPNPHLWTDPILALTYGEIIRDTLSDFDEKNRKTYRRNFDQFAVNINKLDREIQLAVETVPKSKRRLLTYHDSFPYFAKRYEFQIIAAVQPSDFSEPSVRHVAALIDQIRLEQVPAIFGSKSFPSPVMEQIAIETGTEFIDDLRDDDLPGNVGDIDHSYLGLMVKNVESIVLALGGHAENLKTLHFPQASEDYRKVINN